MIEEYELVALLLGAGVLLFIYANRNQLQQLPSSNLFITAFLMFVASWVLTNLEDFFWTDPLNLLEHVSLASGGLVFAVWCWQVFGRGEAER